MRNPLSEAQIAAIALGRAQGKKVTDIAKSAGVSVSTVAHARSMPEVSTMIQELGNQARAQMHTMFQTFLTGISEDHANAKSLDARQSCRAELLSVIGLVDGTLRQEDRTASPKNLLTLLIDARKRVFELDDSKDIEIE